MPLTAGPAFDAVQPRPIEGSILAVAAPSSW
jgi:hypothetical protein